MRHPVTSSLLLTLALAAVAAAQRLPVETGDGYTMWCVGNCNRDVNTTTTPGLILMGGGTDVDDAFEWLNGNANGGDIVVLRTSGTDGYNEYIYDFGGVNSVWTVLISRASGADEPRVEEVVLNAEGVFFAGGDQSQYVNYWDNTRLSRALQSLVSDKGITIGGTSAGLAIQGEFIYTGETGSIISEEALDNPYHRYMDLTTELLQLPFMTNVITDSHFRERDRMGRLITFLARLEEDDWATAPYGIGVSEATAVLVDRNGVARVSGVGAAYFLTTSGRKPGVCEAGEPLTYVDVRVFKMSRTEPGSISLRTWTPSGGKEYAIDVVNGRAISTQSPPTLLY